MVMQPLTGTARGFDGRSSLAHTLDLRLERSPAPAELHIGGWPTGPQRVPVAALALGAAQAGSPCPVGLPDGATLWVDDTAFAQALRAAQGPTSWVERAIGDARAVAAAVLLLVLLVGWFVQTGAGQLATAVLPLVPSRVDQAIGNQAWELIDKQWFVPSQHGARCEALGRRFEQAARSFDPTVALRPLACRRSRDGASGFNAFALPNGQIVLVDGLIEAFNDDQLMVILGHELAHVRHRHGMQALMRQLGVLAVTGAVLGDFSTVAATTLATLRGLAYSRDAEREADAEALRFMASAGLPRALWLEVWDRMALEVARSGGEPPTWLSTHPQIRERRRLAE